MYASGILDAADDVKVRSRYFHFEQKGYSAREALFSVYFGDSSVSGTSGALEATLEGDGVKIDYDIASQQGHIYPEKAGYIKHFTSCVACTDVFAGGFMG